MKKIFGGINLTWIKVIIMAVAAGVYTAVMAMLPAAINTSFSDIVATFEVWILFGIFIIMNSKSPIDSALKCFIFFLISQPLIYLVQDVVNGSQLFIMYYRFWILWTVGCIPMGFIGYYMKKDKWWGLFILSPMLLFLAYHYSVYLSETMFSFPRHLLTTIFCIITPIIYSIAIFKNKIARYVCLVVSIIGLVVASVYCIKNPPIYSTDIISNGEKYQFDDTYKVSIEDPKYGSLYITYDKNIEDWFVHADFKKAGKTTFTLESPTGEKRTFNITIKRTSYKVEVIK